MSLTKQQERELQEAFNLFDRDRSGKISARELKQVFKALDINATDDEIKAVLRQMDRDKDGEISFNEFCKVMGTRFNNKYTYDEVKQAFEFFDRDGSGYITKEELRLALNRLGKLCSDKELNAMISLNDDDGNGKISFDEFQKLLE